MNIYEPNKKGSYVTNNEQIIIKLTKMSAEKERQMLRSFSRLPLKNKLEVLDQHRSIFHQHKQNHQNIANNILTYVSLVLAVDRIISSNEKLDIKALAIKLKNQSQSSKRDKIMEKWAIVKTLKIEQNMSFRQISIYLKKYHKLSVVHSTLHKIWNEIETGE